MAAGGADERRYGTSDWLEPSVGASSLPARNGCGRFLRDEAFDVAFAGGADAHAAVVGGQVEAAAQERRNRLDAGAFADVGDVIGEGRAAVRLFGEAFEEVAALLEVFQLFERGGLHALVT